MNFRRVITFLQLCYPALLLSAFPGQAAQDTAFPTLGDLPSQSGLPDPLRFVRGEAVASKEEWLEKRRPELKALFQHYMYGHWPPRPQNLRSAIEREDKNYFGGKATKREVRLMLGAGRPEIRLLVVVPHKPRGTGPSRRAPTFLGVNFCGNHALLKDPSVSLPGGWVPQSCPGATNNHATEAGRGAQIDVWAIEQSIDRGYAVATFYNGDVEPDRVGAGEGIRAKYAQSGNSEEGQATYDWGTIAAWAWGLQRTVDYLQTAPDIDGKRIAVVGHSRNGKAALVAAAFDDRVALVIPHQAGCGGTAPSRGTIGESVKQINDRFPHWFNAEFKKFNDHPEKLPFDQHSLIALMAPRPILLSNAVEDTWANPAGQFEMLRAAEPVYKLLGAGGLKADSMPVSGQLMTGKLGFYIRPGKHSMTQGDWKIFLDFADEQMP